MNVSDPLSKSRLTTDLKKWVDDIFALLKPSIILLGDIKKDLDGNHYRDEQLEQLDNTLNNIEASAYEFGSVIEEEYGILYNKI